MGKLKTDIQVQTIYKKNGFLFDRIVKIQVWPINTDNSLTHTFYMQCQNSILQSHDENIYFFKTNIIYQY